MTLTLAVGHFHITKELIDSLKHLEIVTDLLPGGGEYGRLVNKKKKSYRIEWSKVAVVIAVTRVSRPSLEILPILPSIMRLADLIFRKIV